jgi:hypothetical protein
MTGKCANPACGRLFDPLAGGKLFRFPTKADSCISNEGATNAVGNLHNAGHYWLCPNCIRKFALVHIEGGAVVLQPKFLEFPVAGGQNWCAAE